jgi:C_GCAxxG_C_C family probable redox protein
MPRTRKFSLTGKGRIDTMLWKKKENAPAIRNVPDEVALEAEGLFRSGKMHCAEAVLTALKNRFLSEMGEVSHLASAFGGGSGSGCLCGAVVGAEIAFGMILRDRKRTTELAKELHSWFRGEYRFTCCRTVRGEDKGICPELTGRVAGKAAEQLARYRTVRQDVG